MTKKVFVEDLTDRELIRLRVDLAREMARRGLPATVGELGEHLAIELFRSRSDLPVLVAAPTGTKNIDALSRDGERYSIKTLQRAKKTGTVYPDPAEPDRQLFEWLLIVLLSDDLALEAVVALTWAQFVEVRSWDSRMKAWYVARSKRALSAGRLITAAQ